MAILRDAAGQAAAAGSRARRSGSHQHQGVGEGTAGVAAGALPAFCRSRGVAAGAYREALRQFSAILRGAIGNRRSSRSCRASAQAALDVRACAGNGDATALDVRLAIRAAVHDDDLGTGLEKACRWVVEAAVDVVRRNVGVVRAALQYESTYPERWGTIRATGDAMVDWPRHYCWRGWAGAGARRRRGVLASRFRSRSARCSMRFCTSRNSSRSTNRKCSTASHWRSFHPAAA